MNNHNDIAKADGEWGAELEELERRRILARQMGGPEALAKHKARGSSGLKPYRANSCINSCNDICLQTTSSVALKIRFFVI